MTRRIVCRGSLVCLMTAVLAGWTLVAVAQQEETPAAESSGTEDSLGTEQAQEKEPGTLAKAVEGVADAIFGLFGGGSAEFDEEQFEFDEKAYEEQMRREQEKFLKMMEEDEDWKASHRQTRILDPLAESGADALHNFCLAADGNLLVCCGGDRVVYEQNETTGDYVTKKLSEPAEIRVLSPAGEQVDAWKLPFKPQAVAVLADGTVFVAGDGTVAKFTAGGKPIKSVDLPGLDRPIEEEPADEEEEDEAAIFEQYREMLLENFTENGLSEEDAQEQTDKMIKQLKKQRKQQREAEIKAIMKAENLDREQAEKRIVEKQREQQRLETEQQRQYARQVNGLAVNERDLFVVCPMTTGYGFGVWRLTHELDEPVQIVTGLRGCCGQMDVQTHGGELYVAENARHRVMRYDRDGQKLDSFGKHKRQAPEGFGGCCEPKNLRFDDEGVLYAAESGPPVIVRRYSPEGEFLGVVGCPSFTTGCVRVTVEVSADQQTVYVMNVQENTIHVLEAIPPEEQAEAAAEVQAASE